VRHRIGRFGKRPRRKSTSHTRSLVPGPRPGAATRVRLSRNGTCTTSTMLVTTRPANPTQGGGNAGQAVAPGSPVPEYPPRKKTPNSTRARRRPRRDAPSDEHELCDRMFPFSCRRPRGNTHTSLSYPVRSPQTLRKPPSDTLKGPSGNRPLGADGASLGVGRPKLRIPP